MCGYQDFIEGDLNILKKCHAIFFIPGWEDSHGCGIERTYAATYNIPAFNDFNSLDWAFPVLAQRIPPEKSRSGWHGYWDSPPDSKRHDE